MAINGETHRHRKQRENTARTRDISIAYISTQELIPDRDKSLRAVGRTATSDVCVLYFSSPIGIHPAECTKRQQ